MSGHFWLLYQRVKNARKRRWESQVWGSTQLKVMVIAVQSGSSTYTPIVLGQWCKCFGSHRHAIDCGMWENLWSHHRLWGWKSTCLKTSKQPLSSWSHVSYPGNLVGLPEKLSLAAHHKKSTCLIMFRWFVGPFLNAANRNIPSFSGQQPFTSMCPYSTDICSRWSKNNGPKHSPFGFKPLWQIQKYQEITRLRLSKSKSTIFCWIPQGPHSTEALSAQPRCCHWRRCARAWRGITWLCHGKKIWLWINTYKLPINIPFITIYRGMNIHIPAILVFTRSTRF